ncbi:RNA polymerase sigma factor [Desmospora activa]|uniref:RNA polymerase sigma factor n=1 Tax=Desmospora activa DSM 45169 TaxID=1121389 RepID=A0A2T4Z7J3_9BACL|nr:sigma-70 family RNA polymerase sigma factor [Desmospora activa]PTM57868.1 RNA polymerase sigma factor (sigma-70 family) [Desmospora activa DSM 45169]
MNHKGGGMEPFRDHDLVERAREGDSDAFAELVRRHRAKAHGWAQSITHDPHMAEDIVQDAFIRAFLRFGTLLESNRFLPWLRRIVQNEALGKVRRGGPYRKEQPFSSLKPVMHESEVNYEDIDSILDYLTRSRGQEEGSRYNPHEILVQKDILETIRQLLSCLSRRERSIFEAYFFEQLTPQEIADLLSTTTGNVYTSLHRAKQKVQRERIRIFLQRHIHIRKGKGLMGQKVLSTPKLSASWTSIAAAITTAIGYTGQDVSLSDVMGYTGHAFRLNIHKGDVDVAGPTAYKWNPVVSRGLAHLGFEVSDVGAQAQTSPEKLTEAVDLIHDSIDRGIPVVTWDLFVPEFGLIYGYDDEAQTFAAVDFKNDGKLPYDQLGMGEIKELAVFALGKWKPVDKKHAFLQALTMAVEHAYGKEPALRGFVQGVAAYDTWIEAFESGTVDPFGNSYNVAVAADARRFATHFLLERSACPKSIGDSRIVQLTARAAVCYAQVYESLQALNQLFPFPAGGNPNESTQRAQAITLLTRAKEEELKGVALMQEIVDALSASDEVVD